MISTALFRYYSTQHLVPKVVVSHFQVPGRALRISAPLRLLNAMERADHVTILRTSSASGLPRLIGKASL